MSVFECLTQDYLNFQRLMTDSFADSTISVSKHSLGGMHEVLSMQVCETCDNVIPHFTTRCLFCEDVNSWLHDMVTFLCTCWTCINCLSLNHLSAPTCRHCMNANHMFMGNTRSVAVNEFSSTNIELTEFEFSRLDRRWMRPMRLDAKAFSATELLSVELTCLMPCFEVRDRLLCVTRRQLFHVLPPQSLLWSDILVGNFISALNLVKTRLVWLSVYEKAFQKGLSPVRTGSLKLLVPRGQLMSQIRSRQYRMSLGPFMSPSAFALSRPLTILEDMHILEHHIAAHLVNTLVDSIENPSLLENLMQESLMQEPPASGVPEHQLDEVLTPSTCDDASQEAGSCTICLSPMDANVCALCVCAHRFHRECVTQWFQSHRTCPICRCDVLSMLSMLSTTGAWSNQPRVLRSD